MFTPVMKNLEHFELRAVPFNKEHQLYYAERLHKCKTFIIKYADPVEPDDLSYYINKMKCLQDIHIVMAGEKQSGPDFLTDIVAKFIYQVICRVRFQQGYLNTLNLGIGLDLNSCRRKIILFDYKLNGLTRFWFPSALHFKLNVVWKTALHPKF